MNRDPGLNFKLTVPEGMESGAAMLVDLRFDRAVGDDAVDQQDDCTVAIRDGGNPSPCRRRIGSCNVVGWWWGRLLTLDCAAKPPRFA